MVLGLPLISLRLLFPCACAITISEHSQRANKNPCAFFPLVIFHSFLTNRFPSNVTVHFIYVRLFADGTALFILFIILLHFCRFLLHSLVLTNNAYALRARYEIVHTQRINFDVMSLFCFTLLPPLIMCPILYIGRCIS